jgi:hypothetical protein
VLLLVAAVVAFGFVVVRSSGPSPEVLEQRVAARAAWEREQTVEQRAHAEAWRDAVHEWRREQGLISAVFLLGNIIIVATFIRSIRANTRDVSALRSRPGSAFTKVLKRGTLALGAAMAIMIVVPIVESVIVGGHGMYSGDQALAAVFTAISFLFVWMVSLGSAFVALWRCRRANP